MQKDGGRLKDQPRAEVVDLKQEGGGSPVSTARPFLFAAVSIIARDELRQATAGTSNFKFPDIQL